VTSCRYDSAAGGLTFLDTKSTLVSPPSAENRSAAVRVHPNGRFVYASNRGPDTIAVFAFDDSTGRLDRVEIVPARGNSPRDITLSPDGKWLVAANEVSNTLTVFRVSADTGRLEPVPTSATISMPVCVVFAD